MLIGIDIGGTNLVAAKVSEDGTILRKTSIPVDRSLTAEELCGQIVALARKAADGDPTITAVGIGFPGLVDQNTGMVVQTPNMPFRNTKFRELFQKQWNIPVYLGNDANCAAIGEYWAGAAKGCDPAMIITLGTGVGGGMVANGKLFTGFCGGAMEIGHMIVAPDGLPCGCGNKGCFEQYGSATALIRITKEEMAKEQGSALWSLCDGDVHKVQGITAFQAVKSGDATAKRVLDRYISGLAVGIANLINILQPEMICLGGGVGCAEEELLYVPLREKVHQYVFDKNAPVPIKRALLGNDAGVIGAAMLCKMV